MCVWEGRVGEEEEEVVEEVGDVGEREGLMEGVRVRNGRGEGEVGEGRAKWAIGAGEFCV